MMEVLMLPFLQANWGLIATGLWVSCELLAHIPLVESNSVLQLIISGIKILVRGRGTTPP